MPRQTIAQGWTLELDEAFERRAQGGDVVFWLPPRTVYATVFATGDVDAEEAMARMLEDRVGEPVRTFDRVGPGLAGHAYLLPEGEGPNQYWGLNTWTAARGSVLCLTFYFEDLDDLDWALRAWESAQCDACGGKYLN